MKLTGRVHLLRREFYVTPTVKRYVNLYLIVGDRGCHLVDAGVAGTEKQIDAYLKSIGKSMSDIRGIFLTHSHSDHIGAAAELKRQSGCRIYAPFLEKDWIEDIRKQFRERPIPGFFELLSEPVKIDCELKGGEILRVEDGIEIRVLQTPGHSHGSMSYILNEEMVFMGDAVPVPDDLPIFTDYEASMQTLDRMRRLSGVSLFCPAWDEVYTREALEALIDKSERMLTDLKRESVSVYQEWKERSDAEKQSEILKRVGLSQYAGNPLVAKSIASCLDIS